MDHDASFLKFSFLTWIVIICTVAPWWQAPSYSPSPNLNSLSWCFTLLLPTRKQWANLFLLKSVIRFLHLEIISYCAMSQFPSSTVYIACPHPVTSLLTLLLSSKSFDHNVVPCCSRTTTSRLPLVDTIRSFAVVTGWSWYYLCTSTLWHGKRRCAAGGLFTEECGRGCLMCLLAVWAVTFWLSSSNCTRYYVYGLL